MHDGSFFMSVPKGVLRVNLSVDVSHHYTYGMTPPSRRDRDVRGSFLQRCVNFQSMDILNPEISSL
jgi:hypothetical protein